MISFLKDWMHLIKKELKVTILGIFQIAFSMFFMVLAFSQVSDSKFVFNLNKKTDTENFYSFAELMNAGSDCDKELLRANLSMWIDEYDQCCSFITSIKTKTGQPIVICIGKQAATLLGLEDSEWVGAYSESTDDEIEVTGAGRTMTYAIKHVEKLPDKIIIRKGIQNIEDAIILCIKYENYREMFGLYYETELINNLHFRETSEYNLNSFCTDMVKSGYWLIPQNYTEYLEDYFGNIYYSGVLFSVFYLIIALFVIYGLYVDIINILKRNSCLHTVQYICGESENRIIIKLCLFVFFIILCGYTTVIMFFYKFDLSVLKYCNVILLFLLFCYVGICYKIVNLFKTRKYEVYMKAERN